MFYFSTYKKPYAQKALKKVAKKEVPSVAETTEMAADAIKSAATAIVESAAVEKCMRG